MRFISLHTATASHYIAEIPVGHGELTGWINRSNCRCGFAYSTALCLYVVCVRRTALLVCVEWNCKGNASKARAQVVQSDLGQAWPMQSTTKKVATLQIPALESMTTKQIGSSLGVQVQHEMWIQATTRYAVQNCTSPCHQPCKVHRTMHPVARSHH